MSITSTVPFTARRLRLRLLTACSMKLVNYTITLLCQAALACWVAYNDWPTVGTIYFGWCAANAFKACWQPDKEIEEGTEI